MTSYTNQLKTITVEDKNYFDNLNGNTVIKNK